MLRDTLSEFAYTPWSLAGLIFFVLMFVLLLELMPMHLKL